jgi:hypothetical protein
MLIRIIENTVFGSRSINRQIVFLQQPDKSFGGKQCSLIPPSNLSEQEIVRNVIALLVGKRFGF